MLSKNVIFELFQSFMNFCVSVFNLSWLDSKTSHPAAKKKQSALSLRQNGKRRDGWAKANREALSPAWQASSTGWNRYWSLLTRYQTKQNEQTPSICYRPLLVKNLAVGSCGRNKIKSHLMRTQSLKVLPLKPGVGQYIAMHATLTAGISSLLISTLPVHSPAFFPFRVFLVLAVANTCSFVGPQNKIGHPPDAGSRVERSQNINRLQNKCYCFSGFAFRNCRHNLSCSLRKNK